MFRRTPSDPLPPDPPPAATPSRRFTDRRAPCDTAVGPGVSVKGALRGSGSVEIAGSFEGPIEIDGLLHVMEGGRVAGSISAAVAVIEGEVEGRLVVAGKLELRGTARVRADIDAPTVAIAEGSVFDGRVNMGGSAEGAPAEESAGAEQRPPVPGGALGAMTFREKRKHKRHRHQHYAPTTVNAPAAAPAVAAAPEPPAPVAPEPPPSGAALLPATTPAAEAPAPPSPPESKPPASA